MSGQKLVKKKGSNKSIKRIYVVFYEPQEFLGNDVNLPIKAFKSKKHAEIYAKSRNFEFQTVASQGEEEYENYVLGNEFRDYTISMSDLRMANNFIRDELNREENKKGFYTNIWEALTDLEPFRVRNIDLCDDLSDF